MSNYFEAISDDGKRTPINCKKVGIKLDKRQIIINVVNRKSGEAFLDIKGEVDQGKVEDQDTTLCPVLVVRPSACNVIQLDLESHKTRKPTEQELEKIRNENK